ncbi:MAG: hypothetical protein EHM87_22345, partial [Burkholderiales bacterium]
MSNVNSIAININSMNRELLNINFWRNTEQIEAYIHNIIQFVQPTVKYNVRVTFGENPYCRVDNVKNITINLPAIPIVLQKSEEDINKLIHSRIFFLKHELAHVLFTPLTLNQDSAELHNFQNAVDDIRIEYLFGQTFKGSQKGFYTLRKLFYNNCKDMV